MCMVHCCFVRNDVRVTVNFVDFVKNDIKVEIDNTISIIYASNYSKDVRLPVQLQRAMAAEAEAAREARAKVRALSTSCLDYLFSLPFDELLWLPFVCV